MLISIGTKITKGLKKEIEKRIKENFVSTSDYLRYLIRKDLEKEKGK